MTYLAAAGAISALAAAGCARQAPKSPYESAINCAGAAEARPILHPDPSDQQYLDEAIAEMATGARKLGRASHLADARVTSDIASERDAIVNRQRGGEDQIDFKKTLIGCGLMAPMK